MPSVDDGYGNAATTKKRVAAGKWTQKTPTASKVVGSKNAASSHERNRDAVTQTDSGSYYPADKFKPMTLPSSKTGMLLAAMNPMGAVLKAAGKSFINQSQYGMNADARTEYERILDLPENKGKSVKELVTLARKPQIDAQLPHAWLDGNPTTAVQKEIAALTGGKAPSSTVYNGDGSVNVQATAATASQGDDDNSQFAVNPDTGDVVETKVEMGKLGITEVKGPDGRPSWAPSLPTEGGAVDPYAPSAPATDTPRPDWAPSLAPEAGANPAYDPYAPTWGDSSPAPVEEEGSYGNWREGENIRAMPPVDDGGGYGQWGGGNYEDGEKRLYGQDDQDQRGMLLGDRAKAPQAQAQGRQSLGKQYSRPRPQAQAMQLQSQAQAQANARSGLQAPQAQALVPPYEQFNTASQAQAQAMQAQGLQAPQAQAMQAQALQAQAMQAQALGLQAPQAQALQAQAMQAQGLQAPQAQALQAQAMQAQGLQASQVYEERDAYGPQGSNVIRPTTPNGTPAYESLQNMVAGNQNPVAEAMQLDTNAPRAAGATIPTGATATDSGTFKPVTFRSGTGTATTDAGGSTTTSLNDPYANLGSLVGAGQGLLTQAAGNAQQAPDQLNFNTDTDQRAADLFAQRSALLDPAFAQQRALAKQDMFGSGRLGLRLAGEAAGAGSGMVQPDAFGINQAQSQALAGLASQSTDDAFAQSQAMAGLDSQRFTQNQAAKQQQYANLTGSGQGMLSAGIQGAQLEGTMAQQQATNQQSQRDYSLAQARLAMESQGQSQNFGLASQGQQQDYGLNSARFNLDAQGQQQNFGLAQQTQDQSYGLAQQNFALAERGQMQDYGLARDQFGLAQQSQDQAYGLAQDQFGLQQRSQNLSELDSTRNFSLASDRFNLASQGQDRDFSATQDRLALDTQRQAQDYGLNSAQFNLASQGQDRGFSETQSRLALDAQRQAQDYGLNSAQFNLASQGQDRDYMLSNRGQSLAELSNSQNYGLANRGQSLSELSNTQNYGLNTDRLALDTLGQKDNLALATLGQSQNYGLQQQQQMQDYGLAQQNYGLAQQQQRQDYGFQQQNYGLAQQQQYQDYGLNQQKMGLAQQQQLQDYEMGMLTGNRDYGLKRDVAAQNYELATEQNRIGLITGQSVANKNNYQPNDWLNIIGGGLSAYAGTAGGASTIGGWFS